MKGKISRRSRQNKLSNSFFFSHPSSWVHLFAQKYISCDRFPLRRMGKLWKLNMQRRSRKKLDLDWITQGFLCSCKCSLRMSRFSLAPLALNQLVHYAYQWLHTNVSYVQICFAIVLARLVWTWLKQACTLVHGSIGKTPWLGDPWPKIPQLFSLTIRR